MTVQETKEGEIELMMKLLNKPAGNEKKQTEEDRLNEARQAKIAQRERSIKRGTVKTKEDHGLPLRYLQKTNDDSLERETEERRESNVPSVNIALRRPEKPRVGGQKSHRELSSRERSRGRDKQPYTLFGNYQHKPESRKTKNSNTSTTRTGDSKPKLNISNASSS